MDPIKITKASHSALKLPTKLEDVFIWRLQIVLTTNTIKDANTDESVFVQFAEGDKNKFWLDKAIDDREKGLTTAYDVVIPALRKVSDIKFLRLGNAGKDGWNLKSLKLVINNQPSKPIFEKSYGTNGLWLEREGNAKSVETIPSATLRAHSKWKPNAATLLLLSLPPFVISHTMLEEVLEGVIGHEIDNQNQFPRDPKMKQLYWGKLHGRPVEVTRKSSNTLHVDLDLAADISYFPDPEVDVDFDIKLGCANKRIKAEVLNIKVNIDSILLDIANFLYPFGDVVKTSFNFNQIFSTGLNIPTKCPDITIAANGDILISYYI